MGSQCWRYALTMYSFVLLALTSADIICVLVYCSSLSTSIFLLKIAIAALIVWLVLVFDIIFASVLYCPFCSSSFSF